MLVLHIVATVCDSYIIHQNDGKNTGKTLKVFIGVVLDGIPTKWTNMYSASF